MKLCQDVCYGPEPSNDEFVGTVLSGIRRVEQMLGDLPDVTLKTNSETQYSAVCDDFSNFRHLQ
jgi:hypothetical protein